MLLYVSPLGKFYDNAGISEPEVVQFPSNERVVDIQTGSGYILALTESGSVYTWGKNSTTSYEVWRHRKLSYTFIDDFVQKVCGCLLRVFYPRLRFKHCV